ncbi:MAG: Do family serine endopeptidase [Bryobacterales bacterium]|nr:Do family serine endopeptidase [Bryobacterales bacterium]
MLARLGGAKLLASALIALTLVVGILIGTLVTDGVGAADAKKVIAPDATPLVVPDPMPVENQFSKIVEQIRGSVVNIHVEAYQRRTSASAEEGEGEGGNGNGGGGQDMEDLFRRFFGMPNAPEGFRMPRNPRRPGEGSGVIVDPAGYILTNKHVVEDADRIQIRFDGEDEGLDAKLIGFDDETDLAVVRVDAKGRKLAVAKLGNSEAVNVGDWAIAMGSPFGFRESVTVGIISAKSREVQSSASRFSRPFQKFFQTDAAINPGNSGGPLLNIRGEVIGINTAIVSRSGAYEGLGFALPSNIAANVYNQIIKNGRVARGSIGIEFQAEIDEATLRSFGAPEGGVLVNRVTEGGPAEAAGIQGEDVIVAIAGKKIADGDALIQVVAATPVGETVPVELVRDGKRIKLDVTIADRAELFAEQLGISKAGPSAPAEDAKVDLGIAVQNLTKEQRAELEYDGDDGIVVTEVELGSFAEDLGLVEGDIIVSVNRRPVAKVSELRTIREGLKPGDDIALKVMRRAIGGWTAQYLGGVLPDGDSGRF